MSDLLFAYPGEMLRRLACILVLALASWLGWRLAFAPAPQVAVPVEPAPEARASVVAEPEPLSAPALAEAAAPSDSAREPLAAPAPPEKKRRLTKGEATLWVEVRSAETGAPVLDVEVAISKAGVLSFSGEEVSALEGALRKFPHTGADGRARFRLPPGAYLLHVFWGGPGLGRGRQEVEVTELADKEERTLRIEIPTGDDLRVRGRALDERTEEPLAGAEVLLFEGNSWGSSWYVYQESGVITELAHTTTDAAGRFELAAPSWKHVMLRVRATGFATGYAAVEPREGVNAKEVEVRLGPSATLVARVEQAGQPVEGIRVSLSISQNWIRGTETERDGRCSFADVPAGVELEVHLAHPAPQPQKETEGEEEDSPFGWGKPPFPYQRLHHELAEPIRLAPGAREERVFQLGALCTLHGIVRDEGGRALPGLRLRLLRGQELEMESGQPAGPFSIRSILEKFPDVFTTDEHGAFVVPDLPSATWWLGPFDDESRYEADARRIAIPEGTTRLELELVVRDTRAPAAPPR